MDINAIIQEWQGLKDEIAVLSEKERELRLLITPLILQDKIEGSKTMTLGSYKLSATAIINYTLDKDELELRKSQLTPEDWTAIDFKPVVKPTIFRKISNDSVLHKIISVKSGLPQLKVVEHYEDHHN